MYRPCDKISPVTICGPYRSGKSFLANQLLQRMSGFEVGESTRACTKGLWIHPTAIELAMKIPDQQLETNMFLLDCEGTNSLERDAQVDTLLMTVATLISSVLLYNT